MCQYWPHHRSRRTQCYGEFEYLTRAQMTAVSSTRASHSPQQNTPHKACNGELSITCRNRHCPKCQGNVRAKWLAARAAELLPVPYFPIVDRKSTRLNSSHL